MLASDGQVTAVVDTCRVRSFKVSRSKHAKLVSNS